MALAYPRSSYHHHFLRSDSTVAPATSAPLYRVKHPPSPVLEQVRDVADSVAVGDEVPASGPVAVVVEPRAEDEVGRGSEEDAGFC